MESLNEKINSVYLHDTVEFANKVLRVHNGKFWMKKYNSVYSHDTEEFANEA